MNVFRDITEINFRTKFQKINSVKEDYLCDNVSEKMFWQNFHNDWIIPVA